MKRNCLKEFKETKCQKTKNVSRRTSTSVYCVNPLSNRKITKNSTDQIHLLFTNLVYLINEYYIKVQS